MRSKAGLVLEIWLFVLCLFTASIGIVVMQNLYHMQPTPWLVAAACITGSVNVLMFPVFIWMDWRE